MKKGKPKGTQWQRVLRTCLSFALIMALALGNIVPINVAKAEGSSGASNPTNAVTDLVNVDFSETNWSTESGIAEGKNTAESGEAKKVTESGNEENSCLMLTQLSKNSNNVGPTFAFAYNGDVTDKTIVYEIKLSYDKNGTPSERLRFRTNTTTTVIEQKSTGKITSSDSSVSAKTESGKWLTLAVVADYKNFVCDIYVNGTCYVEDKAFGETETFLRVNFYKSSNGSHILVDDMRIYEGTAPAPSAVELITEGTVTSYQKGSSGKVTICSSGSILEIESVVMDGTVVESSNYTLTEGPTKVEFAASYLETLSAANHEVTINYTENRSVTSMLSVTGAEPEGEATTEAPTETPTEAPTEAPTETPTEAPTETPTETPTEAPTEAPTEEPTEAPTEGSTEESPEPDDEGLKVEEMLLDVDFENDFSECGPLVGISASSDKYQQIVDPANPNNKCLKMTMTGSGKDNYVTNYSFFSAVTKDNSAGKKVAYEYMISAVDEASLSTKVKAIAAEGGSSYLYVRSGGVLKYNDADHSLGTVEPGKWTKVTFVVDYATGEEGEDDFKYKVYINDVCVRDWDEDISAYTSRGTCKRILGIRLEEAGSILLDNVKAYIVDEAGTPEPDSSESDKYAPDILSVDFDGDWAEFGSFLNRSAANDYVFQVAAPTAENANNKALKMIHDGGASNLSIMYPTGANFDFTGMQVVYEYKLSAVEGEQISTNAKIFASKSDTRYLSVRSGNIKINTEEGAFGVVTPGEWIKVAMVVDYAAGTYKLYVGDTCVKDDGTWSGKEFMRLSMQKSGTGHLLVDDLRVYEGSEPHIPGTGVPVGTEIYVNRTFDEIWKYDLEEIDVTKNKSSVVVVKGTDGNKFLKLNGIDAAEPATTTYLANAESGYIVAHAKLSVESATGNEGSVFTGVGADGKTFSFLNLKDDSLQLLDGTEVAKLAAGSWTDVAVAVDTTKQTYTVFVDGKAVAGAANIAVKDVAGVASIYTAISKGTLLVDDLRVYDAKAPRMVWKVDDTPDTIYVKDSAVQALIGEARAIQLNANVLYANGVKNVASKAFDISDEGKVYLALADIEKLFGANADLTTASKKNDMYDVIAVAKASGYTFVHEMEGRMMLFCKSEITLEAGSTNEKEVNKYLQFDRPTVEAIKDMFSMSNTHPRVLVTQDDVDRIKALYTAGDEIVKRWGDNAIAAAEAALLEADLTFYKYGSSLAHVDVCAPMFINLGFAYFLSDDAEAKAAYVDKVKRTAKTICELPDWNPGSYLDVGELSFLLGLAYDWFYDEFTAEERAYIEKNLVEKGVGIQNKIYYGKVDSNEVYWTWWDNTNNWNLVCNGGAICGAIALYDVYPDICAQVIANTLHGAEFMMESYFPEGVWHEGGGYWNYALRYLAYTMDTMDNVFGDDFGFMCSPGLESTGWYGLKLSGSTGINNFGDAGIAFINNPRVLWCAKMFQNADMMAARLQEMELQGYAGDGEDLLYYDADLYQGGGNAEVPLDTVLDSMSIVSLRERWYDTGATFLGFSGSKTKSGHAHMDTGTFVVDMLGQRIIQEAGAEDYQANGYFSTNRYYYYRTRPEGHNIYIINPTDNKNDYGGYTPWVKATNTPVVAKARGAFSTLDLSNVYVEDTYSAIRGFMLTDDRRSVLVRDEIDFKHASELYSYLHTAAAIEIDPETPNVAILTLKGTRYKVIVDVAGDTVESWTLKDVDAVSRGDYGVTDGANTFRKLKIYVKTNAAGPISITTKIIGYDDPAADKALITTPIAQWSADMIPDGEQPVIPQLDMIYVNGEPLKGFDPVVTGYTGFKYATEKMPVITASSEKYDNIKIESPDDFGENYVITVYDNEDENLYRVYRVVYKRRPALKPVDGRERYPVASMTASDSPQAESHGYTPDSAIDNDFSVSRWTSQCHTVGDSHWLMMELEELSKVYKIGIALVNGQKRQNVFTLEISADGENWTKVFDGRASGTTAGLEYYYENEEGVDVKFVRYTGFGNIKNGTEGISNLWNNVAELVVLGPKETAAEIYELESNAGLDILSTNKTADLTVGEDGTTITGVAVSGTVLAPENFTVADGKTNDGKIHTVSINAAYMESLAPGEYTVTLTYKDGTSSDLKVTVEAPTALEIIEEGTVNEYEINSDAVVTVHTTGLVAKFIGVKVNGMLVAHENYEVTEGSTIVTFKNEYIDTLAAGEYKVEVLYSGGRSVETTLTITVGDAETGDISGAGTWMWMMAIAMMAVSAVTVTELKRKKQK